MIGVIPSSSPTLLTFLSINLSFVLSLGWKRVNHERMSGGGSRVLVLLEMIVIVVVTCHQTRAG